MFRHPRRWKQGAALAAIGALGGGIGVAALPVQQATAAGFAFTRVAGADRFATAATLATQAFPTASTALIATGFKFPDALAGNYLAGEKNAPILLVNASGPVPQATLDALKTLKTQSVVILGLQSAVGNDVQMQLASTPSSSASGGNLAVSRIGGAGRYDTAQLINETPGTAGVGIYQGKRTAFLARGDKFPDALGAGPVAFAQNFPVILTDPNALSPQAAQTIKDLGIQQLLVLGGTGAVSTDVETQANSLGAATLQRFAGTTRSDTSRLIANYAINNFGFKNSVFAVASGDDNFGGADALASGPFSAKKDPIPTLVTNSVNDPGDVVTFARDHASTEQAGFAIGGSNPLPQSTLDQIAAPINSGSGQAFTSSPAAGSVQNVPTGTVVQYTVSNLGTSPVDIQLFNCANTPSQTGGSQNTFTGSNPGGSGNFAQQGSNSATITVVNGSTASTGTGTNRVNGVTPSNGQVTFSITDNTAECVTPVVFAQGPAGPTQDQLALGSNNQPTGPYATGGNANFTPPQAPAGTIAGYNSTTNTLGPPSPTNEVVQVNRSAQYFTEDSGTAGAAQTYNYKATDTYLIVTNGQCVADSFSDFQTKITVGDQVGGVYNPAGTSTFCLNDIAPVAPSGVSASPNDSTQPSSNATTGAKQGGITVKFTDSTTPTAASYNINRANATPPAITGAAYTCPTAASAFQKIATVADANPDDYGSGMTLPGGSATTYYYNDTTVTPVTMPSSSNPQVQYCYTVSTVDELGQEGTPAPASQNAAPPGGTGGVVPAAVPVPANPPMFVATTNSASAGNTVSGGSITVTYNQPITCSSVDPNGSDYKVVYTATSGGANMAVTPSSAACKTLGNTDTQVVIRVPAGSLGTAAQPGASVTVTAQKGSLDSDTVTGTTTPAQTQPVGDAVQISGVTA